MATFKLFCLSATTNEQKIFYYNNETSLLTNENGEAVFDNTNQEFREWFAVSKNNPGFKTSPRTLKIQMGLSCNYACLYCNQRFVPHAAETNKNDIETFLEKIPSWFLGDGTGCEIEFWGGEPLVYWKTLKPLAEELKTKYPKAKMSMVTNGSLLDEEKNEWLEKMDFAIAISHDGPGQKIRGPDPLKNEKSKNAILDLYNRLKKNGNISINVMINNNNQSRKEIYDFFKPIFGEDVVIGEGGFIDPYDEGGLAACLSTYKEHIDYRNKYLVEIRNGDIKNFQTIRNKLSDFYRSLADYRPSNSVGQKCGMDDPQSISVDLKGNVLTCQNVSSVATSMNGEAHKIGHIDDLENVKLTTATHWSKRPECQNCPVLQLCKGSCMFLENEFWEKGCNNSFSDNIPLFAAVIESITGYLPYYIEGPQRNERKDVFGIMQAQNQIIEKE